MDLFLLRKCHSGNCLCSLIDSSRRKATHAHVSVMCMWKRVRGKKKDEEVKSHSKWLQLWSFFFFFSEVDHLKSFCCCFTMKHQFSAGSGAHRNAGVDGSIPVKQSEPAGRGGLAVLFSYDASQHMKFLLIVWSANLCCQRNAFQGIRNQKRL